MKARSRRELVAPSYDVRSGRRNVGFTHQVLSPVAVAVVIVTADLRQSVVVVDIGRQRRRFPHVFVFPLCPAWVIVELRRPVNQHKHTMQMQYKQVAQLLWRQLALRQDQ